MSDTLTDYDTAAQVLGLNEDEPDNTQPSSYWGHLEGDELGSAVVDRFRRFREWQQSEGLTQGWRLKCRYFYNEYRSDPLIKHLAVMEQFGAQGEFSFLPINNLRSVLKTVLASVTQNPPNFKPRAINSDADAMEAAALHEPVLDYYSRELKLGQKINKATELGLVVDQGFALVEWDPFAEDGQQSVDPGIWKGAPSVKVLGPLDVVYDVTKSSWADQDWVIVRDFADKERLIVQFPEMRDDIEGCRLRGTLMQENGEYEINRFTLTQFPDLSNDVQVFKLFHRSQPWLPGGRFAMFLESGKMLFNSPLIYPKLPVERFVCDEQVDILLGYSPINELLGVQESVNSLVSSITSNAANYANQFIACEAGTDLNPRTLATGQAIIEYPPGRNPPQGLNLTAIPSQLFEHLKDLMSYMEQIPNVSNASRGQAPGANSTGSAMLFLSGQTTANQGSMSDNYAQFSAAVMTSLLHVLRVFGRTPKTIAIMGKTVASKEIVLAEALKNFDEVVVDLTNPLLSTPQGKMALAQQFLQFGNATPQQVLQVATSGTLGPAEDPARETLYEIESENEWLLDGEQQILVNALDDHEQHIMQHKRLLAMPWLRNPAVAAKIGRSDAPQIMANIQQHIFQHMQFLAGNQQNSVATNAGQQPGQPETAPSPALGHAPPVDAIATTHIPGPNGAAPVNAPAQAQAVQAGTHLPNQPSMPQPRQ